ncbi:MAG: T9SS type A sorting domain-containing protein [Bacteroidia bacterium]
MKPRNRNTLIPSLHVRWKLTLSGILAAAIILAGIFGITETTVTEVCGNGTDDDGDGLIDCADPDCENSWDCLILPIGDLEETGSWAGSGYGPYTASTPGGEIAVTANITYSGNARFSATPSGSFGSGSFWKRTIQGKTSLETVFTWDRNPESGTSDIDSPSDDKGTGEITFAFSETVKNPVLHVDRIGGWGGSIASSAIFTVKTPAVSLVRMSGTDDFQVTGTTFFRTPDVTTTAYGEALQSANLGTAAGTIVVKGTFASVTFSYTGTGVEGTGGDGIEFIWTLDNGSALLPVEWLSLAATADGEDATIYWETARELNTDYFEIERKKEGSEPFESIGKLAAAGVSDHTTGYMFRDAGILRSEKSLIYRIRQVDMDGKFTYSSLAELRVAPGDFEIMVYPNPAQDQVMLSIGETTGTDEAGTWAITNMSGQVMWQGKMNPDVTNMILDVSEWPGGIYAVSFQLEQRMYHTSLIVQ